MGEFKPQFRVSFAEKYYAGSKPHREVKNVLIPIPRLQRMLY